MLLYPYVSSMAAVVASILILTGCSKQGAVEAGLTNAGVSAPVADCMSVEMAKRLSTSQLQKLSRADIGEGKTLSQLTTADYIERARRIGDAEVVAVTGLAAAFCSQSR